MKGLISGIKCMEIHDGDGCRTTVFFKGCPLKCLWCHNPESISYEPQVAFFREKCIGCGSCRGEKSFFSSSLCPVGALVSYGEEVDSDVLAKELAKDAIFFQNSGGGVTLSGGECLSQPDFAVEVAKKLSEKGISVYVDTCGFVHPKTLERIAPYTDRFLYDVKAIAPEVHKRCTGQENSLILKNLICLSEQGCEMEIRYPLVNGYNDGECEAIGRFLKDLPGIVKVKVLQYHSFAGSRYEALGMKNTLPERETTYRDVANAVAVLKGYGLNAVNGIDET